MPNGHDSAEPQAEPPFQQADRAVQSTIAVIEDAMASLGRQRTQGLDEPPQAPRSAGEAIEGHINGMVARYAQECISKLDRVAATIAEFRALLVADCEHVQNEIQAHVRMGETVDAAAEVVGRHVRDLRLERAAKLAARAAQE